MEPKTKIPKKYSQVKKGVAMILAIVILFVIIAAGLYAFGANAYLIAGIIGFAIALILFVMVLIFM
jgi:membrane protein YdbS with pleckstrin-like domain